MGNVFLSIYILSESGIIGILLRVFPGKKAEGRRWERRGRKEEGLNLLNLSLHSYI
jgi:hypothetical protein